MPAPSRRLPTPLHLSRLGCVTCGPSVALPAGIERLIREISEMQEPSEKEQPMPSDNYDADIIVIGAGPGGYVAAIRAAQLGASVTVVEKEFLGGTCLNWGCIPSKAMIASVERMHAVKDAEKMGVSGVVADDIKMDLKKFNERKKKIVETQRGGIGQLFKKNKINHVEGMAKFVDPHTIEIEKDGEKKKLRAKNFILAMGAKAIHLPISGLEGGPEDGVWTSDDAVTLPGDKVPKKMAIIGGGAVGSEFAYVYNGLGAEIHLVELMDTLCPMFDSDLGKELGRSLKKQGINVYTESSVEKVEKQKNGWKVFIKTGDKTKEVEVDVVLMGVGRK
ncbi:MAG: dihydrolipoyl dehydrogenase family protein, partial [Fimbriimonadaceae bacterium]